ncbi:MAG: hypothetical protein D6795_08920, partial [Deltaproteobacteria bacterium]
MEQPRQMDGIGVFCGIAVAAAMSLAPSPVRGEGAYLLAYWRELGVNENSLNHSIFVHVFRDDGAPVSGVDIYTSWDVLLGRTDPNGFLEIPVYTPNGYDVTVVDGVHPSQTSPLFETSRPPSWGHYSWEVGFLYAEAGEAAGTFDTDYRGILNSEGDAVEDLDAPMTKSLAYASTVPEDATSDAFSLAQWSDTFGQTFVARGNRVIACKFQFTTGFGNHLRWKAQIRAGGPGGAPVGPPADSREMVSDEYWPILVTWGIDDVPVTPGETYYVELSNADGGGLNTYRVNGGNYPEGTAFYDGVAQNDADLMGFVLTMDRAGTEPEPIPTDLVNGDFEAGFLGGVANGWTSFRLEGNAQFLESNDVVHGGEAAQWWWTSYTTHRAGIYQRVKVGAGKKVTFRAWTWRQDAWNNDNVNEETWVGIDPTGSTNPSASSIVWSSGEHAFETWTEQTVSATATNDVVTLLVQGKAYYAGANMVTVVDDAELTVTNSSRCGIVAPPGRGYPLLLLPLGLLLALRAKRG